MMEVAALAKAEQMSMQALTNPHGSVSFQATKETKKIVDTALTNNEVVLEGPLVLGSVNIGDARCYNSFLTSRSFVMYLVEGEPKVIYGNFVVKVKDANTIDKIYKWI